MVFPFEPNQSAPQPGGRKMSAIIVELAALAYKTPLAVSSEDARAVALAAAGAAWNMAVGDEASCASFLCRLEQNAAKGSVPWAQLRANNAAELIALMVEFKKKRYPDDLRIIGAIEEKPDGVVRVVWREPDPAPARAAPTTRSREGLATKPAGTAPLVAVPQAVPRVAAPQVAPQPARGASAGGTLGRRQPIADKLLRALNRFSQNKVVDLRTVIAGRKDAEDLHQTIVSPEVLAECDPAHAVYVYAQNVMSVLSEQITGFREMNRFVALIAEAEDTYMPSGPPMSPLTASYFTCWAFFDACVGIGKETIGSVAIAVASALEMNGELLGVMRVMERSRMGVYVHQGVDQGTVLLREMVTGRSLRAISPAGYLGQKGEVWYVRVLPPPFPGPTEHVVFTTPYVLLNTSEYEWQGYFRRILPDAPQEARSEAYEQHMKFGPSRRYWNEFLLDAYLNFRTEVIYLAGVPDIPESLPHGRVNRG